MPKVINQEEDVSLGRQSAVNAVVSLEARYGTPPVNTAESFGSVITNLKMKQSVGHHTFYEDDIKAAFLEAFNSLIENREEILKGYEAIIETLTDTSRLDKERAKLQSECEIVAELVRKCVEENASTAIDQAEYQERYTGLLERYDAIKIGISENINKRQERNAKRESIGEFIKMLEVNDALLAEFDEEIWNATIEEVTVFQEQKIIFTFKDGLKLNWNL